MIVIDKVIVIMAFHSFLFIFHLCAWHMHVYAEVDAECLPICLSTLYIEMGSLTKPEAHCQLVG